MVMGRGDGLPDLSFWRLFLALDSIYGGTCTSFSGGIICHQAKKAGFCLLEPTARQSGIHCIHTVSMRRLDARFQQRVLHLRPSNSEGNPSRPNTVCGET